jgi:predicted metal-dependent phosphoesterase TrpH
MLYRADFHIHSCLSPCASLEMSPCAMVYLAKEVFLYAIALSYHKCAFNLPAFA